MAGTRNVPFVVVVTQSTLNNTMPTLTLGSVLTKELNVSDKELMDGTLNATYCSKTTKSCLKSFFFASKTEGFNQKVQSPQTSQNGSQEKDIESFLVDENQLHTYDDLTKVNPVTTATGTEDCLRHNINNENSLWIWVWQISNLFILCSPKWENDCIFFCSAEMSAGQIQHENVLH